MSCTLVRAPNASLLSWLHGVRAALTLCHGHLAEGGEQGRQADAAFRRAVDQIRCNRPVVRYAPDLPPAPAQRYAMGPLTFKNV